MIQLLGDCPQTLTRVLPLDATAYFRPQTHTFVPTPRKYKIQWGGMATGLKTSSCFDKVASILLPFCFRRQCRRFRQQCRRFWRHCRWCGRGFSSASCNKGRSANRHLLAVPSGFFSRWPQSLELSSRFYPGPHYQCRLF